MELTKDNNMKVFEAILEDLVSFLAVIIGIWVVYKAIVLDTDPSNFEIYLALLLYIQAFVKHKKLWIQELN